MFFKEAFKNEFDQCIMPGEPVLFVSTVSHQSAVEKGVLQGVNRDDNNNITSVRVKRDEVAYSWSPTYATLPLKRVYKYVD
jgi:hypothetical protein